MGNHHEPLSYLGPVDWADVSLDDLKPFLDDVFSAAQTVVESVPSPSNLNEISRAAETPALPRSQSESSQTGAAPATSPSARRLSLDAVEQSRKLREEWKEVKVNSRENPLDIKVYKLAAKDGKGTWFARRSVHDGLSYDQWEKGLAEELIETLKIQGQPGGGSIRGIGADRLVEQVDAPGSGQAKVFHLSAQFPGPTSPRDFVTLLLSSGAPKFVPGDARVVRQFMIVSKPCIHPECEPQQGTIRGQYESIELIREVLPEKPASERSSSSTDISGKSKSSDNLSTTTLDSPQGTSKASEPPTTIEWLMITRSDPGGSVPRFMIEKGTPPGIVNDAGKFIKWVTSRSASQDVRESTEGGDVRSGEDGVQDKPRTESRDPPPYVEALPSGSNETSVPSYNEEDVASSNGGLWGMVTGAFWGASSVVSAGLRMPFGTSSLGQDEDEEIQPGTPSLEIGDEEDSGSDTSSIRTFTSALDRSMTQEEEASADVQQSNSDDKSSGKSSQLKELKKLEERRRKLDEKAARMAERWESKRQEDKEKDAAALTRAQEKHAKEVAKHEAKYNRELRRIKEKKEQEERKAEQRRKKAAEREAKANAAMELEKVKAERDYALKQVELLKAQVGELQSQNTMLTAKLGKLNGLDTSDSASVSSKNTQGGKSPKL